MRTHRFFLLTLAVALPGASARATEVTFVPAAQVARAFVKGMPLTEQPDLKVHASRREAPGQAEIHARDTDVIYVIGGTATIVTGGQIVQGTTVAPDEIRGTSIADGTPRPLRVGDVLVVPRGVPHQFTEVAAPFTYYVVKVTGDSGAGQ
jgi:mannose-6-phosphate isomerase-like protein (cupin superfamily)